MDHYNKVKRKHIISITISIMIIFLVVLNIVKINLYKEQSNYKAEKGVLDLTNWDPKEEIIKLDGDWEFYPGKLLKSKEEFRQATKEYIKVPGSWESYLNDEAVKNGSGTYRLIIKVPEDKVYGIRARTIRIANRIYLNGEEVASAGNPSLDTDKVKAGSKYNIGVGDSIDREMELVVHVTSVEYRSGGIIKSIQLGEIESIIKLSNRKLILDAMIVAICLCLGLYFLLIFFERSKDPYLFYFSLTNIFMGINLSSMNEQILRLLYDYNFITRIKIIIISMVMVTVCFLRFIHFFFLKYSNKKITNIITLVMLVPILFTIGDPYRPGALSIGSLQKIVISFMAISYIYMFYVLIKAMYKKTDSLEYILIIIISMFSYWVLLALKVFLEIDLGDIHVILILFVMFGVAALMSHRLQLDYERAKKLSEKLIRDDSLKDEFLFRSTEELRKPLYNILNLMKTLLEGKNGTFNTKQQEDLLFIYQEAERLNRLTDGLQDASLIKKEKIKLTLTAVDSYEIVESILEEIEILIPHNESVILKNEIPRDLPLLKVDADRFRQIIYDLVDNAIKYTKEGEISIFGLVKSGQAEIQIRDTGKGIEEKYIEEIFDVFYKNNDKEEHNDGLGLGLSIVKHLVENHGGKIEVESVYGEGSNFKITLPLYNKEDKVILHEDENLILNTFLELSSTLDYQKQHNIKKSNILIIDDNILSQRLLCNIINEMNYNVILATSGRKGLDLIVNNKIDLVILDFILIDMTVSQICEKIREDYSMVELPLIVLTESKRTIDLMSAFNYGVNDFQRRPIDSEELKTRIKSLLLIKKSAEEGLEKEFQYFYSQISPHFLYNTLNSIIGLSYKDSEKTRKALHNLSIYFRGKLDIHRKTGLVTLESELELMTAYLEIEEMRYGERLQIEYDIEEGVQALIPPLSLQPIVENCVYHGIANKDSGGKIRIATTRHPEGFITIIIEDNGMGITLEKQNQLLNGNNQGIGFSSVVERIRILKGASLNLESELEKGTRVKIIIPEVKHCESDFS